MIFVRQFMFFSTLLMTVLIAIPAKPVTAAELIMFEQKGCVWCARFNAEIAPAYSKTEEGQMAPLRRVDIHEPIPEDLKELTIDRFTPTFVIVEDGKEIGRIRGYPGDEFFWFLINGLIADLPDQPAG